MTLFWRLTKSGRTPIEMLPPNQNLKSPVIVHPALLCYSCRMWRVNFDMYVCVYTGWSVHNDSFWLVCWRTQCHYNSILWSLRHFLDLWYTLRIYM